MKIRTTLTLVAETEVDPNDYKTSDDQPMTPEAIVESIQQDIHDDWESELQNYDFELSSCTTVEVKDDAPTT